MDNKQVFVSLEMLAIFALLLGVGVYIYFLGNPLNSLPELLGLGKANVPTPQISLVPTIVIAPTPAVADLTGVVQEVKGTTINIKDVLGNFYAINLNEMAPIYEKTQNQSGEAGEYTKVDITAVKNGDSVAVYLQANEAIQSVVISH